MKILHLALSVLTGALLFYGALEMPSFGDPDSPASTHVSPRYIENVMEETHVPNMVTAVLADYRGFDTLGETTVIFTAGVCCLLILRRREKDKREPRK